MLLSALDKWKSPAKGVKVLGDKDTVRGRERWKKKGIINAIPWKQSPAAAVLQLLQRPPDSDCVCAVLQMCRVACVRVRICSGE